MSETTTMMTFSDEQRRRRLTIGSMQTLQNYETCKKLNLNLNLNSARIQHMLIDLVKPRHAHPKVTAMDNILKEARLIHRAVSVANIGITISDMRLKDRPLIFINEAFTRMTGYSSEESLGRNCRFLQGTDTSQPGIQLIRDAVACGVETTVLLRNFRKAGESFCNELTVSPVRDDNGQVTHYMGFQNDVSDREAAALEIRSLNARLTDQALELQAKNEALESFSYSASHDLRAPLAAIQGFTSMLGRDVSLADSPRIKHYLARIDANTLKMAELIEALLNLGKASAGTLHLVQCDISAMATNVLALCAEKDPLRVVKVRVQAGLLVMADRPLFERALENLLSNAWKFTRKAVNALIEVGSEVDENGGLVLYVKDNGAGFDATQADKLFGAFSRLHSSSEFEGTGIGLALVRRVLQRHGGAVWAKSVPDEGSTFFFKMSGT